MSSRAKPDAVRPGLTDNSAAQKTRELRFFAVRVVMVQVCGTLCDKHPIASDLQHLYIVMPPKSTNGQTRVLHGPSKTGGGLSSAAASKHVVTS